MNFNTINQYTINNNFGKINYGMHNKIEESSSEENVQHHHNNEVQQSFFTISKQGKAMSVIDSLTKQKNELLENKNALIAKTLAEGGEIADISAELEMYEEKMNQLEDKIAEERVKEQEEAAAKKKQDPKLYSNSNNNVDITENNLTEKLSNAIELPNDLGQVEKSQAIQDDVEAQIRIIEGHLKNGAEGSVKEAQLEEIAELKTVSKDISADVNEKISENITVNTKEETKIHDDLAQRKYSQYKLAAKPESKIDYTSIGQLINAYR